MIKYYFRWTLISCAIGILSGTASAVFLTTLDFTTEFREAHSWLLFLLPIGGLTVGSLYYFFGQDIESGSNLIIDEFHEPKRTVPLRMTPLVLIATLLTHLFGGSAGREGTAVQMGASIADQFKSILKLESMDRRTLLMAGMAGGFGSVFGVPFAGTFFGIEVLSVGKLHIWALFECAIAAFVANFTTLAWGVHHSQYVTPEIPSFVLVNVLYSLLAGIIFGLAARLFALLVEAIKTFSKKLISNLVFRACLGGALLSLIYFYIPESTKYAGLGVPIIVSSLKLPLPSYDWISKLAMTALTLGTGFKGGEVTPLLFVGSALGNSLSQFLPMALPLLAAMGFVGVFAGAANTPFACVIMAMELFGPGIFLYAALACFAAYTVSGHRGIYHTQRIAQSKKYIFNHVIEFKRQLK